MVSSTTGIAVNEGLGVAEWGSRLSLRPISFFQNSSCSNFYAQADVIVSTRRGAKMVIMGITLDLFSYVFLLLIILVDTAGVTVCLNQNANAVVELLPVLSIIYHWEHCQCQ